MVEGTRRYRYVGPAEIREAVRAGEEGHPIGSPADLLAWLSGRPGEELDEPFTFVIDLAGTMRLAPRRSEHVSCAGGTPVLSAGEITFGHDHGRWSVTEISNQSTGYCPDLTSWPAVQAALDRAALTHPGGFTRPIVFRRCPGCGERSIVKDNDFVCAICDTDLPQDWNLEN